MKWTNRKRERKKKESFLHTNNEQMIIKMPTKSVMKKGLLISTIISQFLSTFF